MTFYQGAAAPCGRVSMPYSFPCHLLRCPRRFPSFVGGACDSGVRSNRDGDLEVCHISHIGTGQPFSSATRAVCFVRASLFLLILPLGRPVSSSVATELGTVHSIQSHLGASILKFDPPRRRERTAGWRWREEREAPLSGAGLVKRGTCGTLNSHIRL